MLSASLCIEQSYEGIAGDSASAAEMYALLSSLAHLPLDQGIAVTGSVNQKGELQPISGINEKIEGFFEVCRLQGLTGRQGVILPPQNIDDLMLRQDVVRGHHRWAVSSVCRGDSDAGLPILTGVQASTSRGKAIPLTQSMAEWMRNCVVLPRAGMPCSVVQHRAATPVCPGERRAIAAAEYCAAPRRNVSPAAMRETSIYRLRSSIAPRVFGNSSSIFSMVQLWAQ